MDSSIGTYMLEVANDLPLFELQICCPVLEAPLHSKGLRPIGRLTHISVSDSEPANVKEGDI